MAAFDDWVTDPAVTRAGVEAFAADPRRVGERYLGRYAVGVTSGTTGDLGIFLHDEGAITVYRALTLVRGWLPWMTPARLVDVLGRRDRIACVVATSGHYTSFGMMEVARRRRPWPFDRIRVFSVLAPTPELVRALNAFQPVELIGYASTLEVLAAHQAAGRLTLRPALVGCGGESLTPRARQAIEAAFGCPVRENYGASELPRMAWSCRVGRLHLGADWAILEPVDAQGAPVPPDRPSASVLLTNLANRVQPLIRYDLGDRVIERPGPCECGSPLPAVEVDGRADEILALERAPGAPVLLGPRALATLVEETPGVRRYQVIQTGPARLTLRIEPAGGVDPATAWTAVSARVRAYLAREGLAGVRLEAAADPPRADPVSGKYRKVWRA
jgi:phenylacetate-coenzyme A ligase PaaK-like adenylate-forming protein